MKTISLPLPLSWLRSFDFPHKLGICEKLFSSVLARNGVCWVQTSTGIKWKLDLANPTHRWIVYGKYEGASFLNWAKEFLPPNGVVIDSGANIGQMLLYLAQWVPQGKVLAFEPNKAAADWLKECLAEHTNLPVELLPVALGAAPANLYLYDDGLSYIHGAWSRITQTEGEKVQVIRLSDQLDTKGIKTVDLWKLDVEGYEIPALKGAKEFLLEHRIKGLYIELVEDNGQRVRDFLSRFSYVGYLFSPTGKLYQPHQWPKRANGLFLPKH